MVERIREIWTTGVGFGYKGSAFSEAKRCLYIARDENGSIGLVYDGGETFLPFEYDSIVPITFGIWQISKKGKVGAICLSVGREDHEFHLDHLISCKYDYITSFESEKAIKLSRYGSLGDHDIDDLYFPKIDLLLEDAYCDHLTYETFLVYFRMNDEVFFINADDGRRVEFDARWKYCFGCNWSDEGPGRYFVFFDFPAEDGGRDETIIVHITEDWTIDTSEVYSGFPTVIYDPAVEGETNPIAFIGYRNDSFYYVNRDFFEKQIHLDSFGVYTGIAGTTPTGKKVEENIAMSFAKDDEWGFAAHFTNLKI